MVNLSVALDCRNFFFGLNMVFFRMQKLVQWPSVILILFILTSFHPRPITWTALGDSITYLNDHPDETGNRVTKGYMTRVTDSLGDVTFINQGHNGWTSVGIAKAIEQLGLRRTDVYSVLLGTNDWWQGIPAGTLQDFTNNTGTATVSGAFRIIIDKIRSLNQRAKIILITPMQRGDFVYIADKHNNAWGSYKAKDGQVLASIVNAIKAIGEKERITVIDLYNNESLQVKDLVKFKRLKDPSSESFRDYTYPDYLDIPFNADKDQYPYPMEAIGMTYDGLHPSDAGNEVIAGLIRKEISKFE